MAEVRTSYIEIKPPFTLDKGRDPADPQAQAGFFKELKNYLPGRQILETRMGMSHWEGKCSALTNTAGAVTAIHKFYHADTDKFGSAGVTSTDDEHEIHVITMHSADSTSQTWRRYTYANNATASTSSEMLNGSLTADTTIIITGATTGDIKQLNSRIYYSNYDSDIVMAYPRSSAGEANSLYVYKAGLPDPNARRVINYCEDPADWLYSAGGGGGEVERDGSPLHRLQGLYSVSFSQTQANKWSTITYTAATAIDCSTFEDTTATGNYDFVAFELFRFAKAPIGSLYIRLSSSGFTAGHKYWEAPIVVSPSYTDHSGNPWKMFMYSQGTLASEWAMNYYDNQMFRCRIRKGAFTPAGTAGGTQTWSAIKTVQFVMKSADSVSTSNPAKVTVDNIRMLKTPPVASTYRKQWATFEEQESGSTTGWLKDDGTRCTFNKIFAKQGLSCLEVPGRNTAEDSPTCTLTYSSPKDFLTYPDGTEANSASMIKVNMVWKGVFGINLVATSMAKFRFTDSSGYYSEFRIGLFECLLGGGATVQRPFDPGTLASPGTGWTNGGGGTTDWTTISSIKIWGGSGVLSMFDATNPMFVDDLRLELPEVLTPINPFEPLELYATSWLSDNVLEPILKFFNVNVEKLDEWLVWLYKALTIKAVGMGSYVYPDEEHSSIGFSSLRLNAYGSMPFTVKLNIDLASCTNGTDLTNFYVPVFSWPGAGEPWFEWTSGTRRLGLIKWEQIPAGPADYFEIWLASPDASKIESVIVKFHPDDGTGNGDEENYFEYEINGSLIHSKIRQSKMDKDKDSELVEFYGRINKALTGGVDEVRLNDITSVGAAISAFNPTNPNMYDQIKNKINDVIKFLGKDRGGWPSATFRFKRSDLRQVNNGVTATANAMTLSNIRGHSVGLKATGGNATCSVDNLLMIKEGSLRGTFYYKVLLEDNQGYLSNSSEPSIPITVDKKDIILTDIYVPPPNERNRIKNKRLYRLGGNSSVWSHIGDVAVLKDTVADKMVEEDMGNVMPEDGYGPPRARVMQPIGNCMYYGDVVDRLYNIRPYRVYKSEAFNPGRVKDLSCIDLPTTEGIRITAIHDFYNHIVIFTQNGMWTTTRALEMAMFRTDIGCIARRSLVTSFNGMIWLSRDGLMIGDISGVDKMFFRKVNPMFESYTERQQEDAIGFIDGDYYYLFWDQTGDAKGVVCHIADGSFAEITGLAPRSVAQLRGDTDNNTILYGTSNGLIRQMFSNSLNDNGTAIATYLETFDASAPGIQYDKYLKGLYVAGANLHSSGNSVLVPTPSTDQDTSRSAITSMTFTSTAVSTKYSIAEQGVWGTHIGMKITGTNRHRINQMIMKITSEPDSYV